MERERTLQLAAFSSRPSLAAYPALTADFQPVGEVRPRALGAVGGLAPGVTHPGVAAAAEGRDGEQPPRRAAAMPTRIPGISRPSVFELLTIIGVGAGAGVVAAAGGTVRRRRRGGRRGGRAVVGRGRERAVLGRQRAVLGRGRERAAVVAGGVVVGGGSVPDSGAARVAGRVRRRGRGRGGRGGRLASSSHLPLSWRLMPASIASRKSGKSRSKSGSIVSSASCRSSRRVLARRDQAVAAVVRVDRLDLLGRVRPALGRGAVALRRRPRSASESARATRQE